jgi:(p)ppGpp synthase/HD superfamily hydrolase
VIFAAVEFAAKAHAGQYRKGTKIPYLLHPLNVARILIEHGCREAVVVAGILHDTLEDTPVTPDQIRERFGDEAAELVLSVSEPNKSDHTWENRKVHTLRHLDTAPPEVLLLSLADKLDNIRSIREDAERLGEAVWRRFNRSREKQEWYYRRLAEAFAGRIGDGLPGGPVAAFRDEVDRVFTRPDGDRED